MIILLIILTVLFLIALSMWVILRRAYSKLYTWTVKYVSENTKLQAQSIPVVKVKSEFDEDKVDPNTIVMVGRWTCCQCGYLMTLNYHRNMYNLSPDELDITGSYRSYDCGKCGCNLMQFKLTEVPYHTLCDLSNLKEK